MFVFDLVVVFLILIVVGYICSALALFFLNLIVLLLGVCGLDPHCN
jgi:hypothetical protein